MADARAGGIEVDAVIFCEGFDGPVLFLVSFVFILDVVVEGEDQLLRIMDLLCADAFEFAHDRRGVVVRHHVVRADGDEVTGAQRALGALGEVSLRDFFNDGLRHKLLRPFHDDLTILSS